MQENNLEGKVQDIMGGFTIDPSEKVWGKIQADLAGAYPAIRQFLRALLAQDQAAAVDSLEFSRPPGSGGVRAQVRMTLYLRAIAS